MVFATRSLDLPGELLGVGTCDDLLPHTLPVKLSGREVLCLDIDWLIAAKRAGRPRDLEAIAELEVLREEPGGGSAAIGSRGGGVAT